MLLGELEGGLDKMVVFGNHRNALLTVRDYLWRHGIKAGCVIGDTSEKERQAIITSFQGDPDFRVILCNIRAAGTGLTLTAAAHIDMLESDWAPASNYQAIKRVHRITQTRNVRARLITLANSFDTDVQRIVAEKTAAVGELEMGMMADMAAMLS
jgi:SNF2 family DNA or RNA helicase